MLSQCSQVKESLLQQQTFCYHFYLLLKSNNAATEARSTGFIFVFERWQKALCQQKTLAEN